MHVEQLVVKSSEVEKEIKQAAMISQSPEDLRGKI